MSDKHASHCRRERALRGMVLAATFAVATAPTCHAQSDTSGTNGWSQAVVENRRDCDARLQAAYRALKDGDYEEAVRRYSSIDARNCPHAEMEIAINRGMAYHHLGRFEEAMRDFDVAVKFDPGDRHVSAVLHNNRCFSLTVLGRAAEALPDCDKAVSLSRRANEVYLSTRGFAYLRLGRYREALRDFDTALKSNPKMAATLYSRGVAKLRLGLPGGDTDITAALALDPTLGQSTR